MADVSENADVSQEQGGGGSSGLAFEGGAAREGPDGGGVGEQLDREAALVDAVVVPAAEEQAVVGAGGAAVAPVDAVVDLAGASGDGAAGVAAAAVAGVDDLAQRWGPVAGGSPVVDGLGDGVEQQAAPAAVAADAAPRGAG